MRLQGLISENLSIIAPCPFLTLMLSNKVLAGGQEKGTTGNTQVISLTVFYFLQRTSPHGEPSFGSLERNPQLTGLRSIAELKTCFLIRRSRG